MLRAVVTLALILAQLPLLYLAEGLHNNLIYKYYLHSRAPPSFPTPWRFHTVQLTSIPFGPRKQRVV